MLPVGALAGLSVALLRLVANQSKRGPIAVPSLPSDGVFVGRWFTAIAVMTTGAVLGGLPGALIVLPVTVTLAMPELVIEGLLIPLGWTEGALQVGRLLRSQPAPIEQRPRAALAAARAYLRRPRPRGAHRIAGHLAPCLELGTAGAAASAILALGRGEVELARSVFGLLVAMGRASIDRRAARTACEFVMLDAAARGDWHRVLATASQHHASSRLTHLLADIARRALGFPTRGLWLRWILAPHRRATRAILRSVRPPGPEGPRLRAKPDLAAFVALLGKSRTARTRGDVALAVASLDAMQDSKSLVAEVTRRALALGVATPTLEPGAIRNRLVTEGEEDVAAFLLEERLPATWIPRARAATACACG